MNSSQKRFQERVQWKKPTEVSERVQKSKTGCEGRRTTFCFFKGQEFRVLGRDDNRGNWTPPSLPRLSASPAPRFLERHAECVSGHLHVQCARMMIDGRACTRVRVRVPTDWQWCATDVNQRGSDQGSGATSPRGEAEM